MLDSGVIDDIEWYGEAALVAAARYVHTDACAEQLRGGANVHATGWRAATPLREAASTGIDSLCFLLLLHVASMIPRAAYDRTVLLAAARSNTLQCRHVY